MVEYFDTKPTKDTPMTPRRRLGEQPITLKYLMLYSDISLSCFILGCGLIVWGVIAGFISPLDIFTFIGDVSVVPYPVFWILNYIVMGVGFIAVTLKGFPRLPSLFIGSYGALIWTWIGSSRGVANFTSGATLNLIVIAMSILLIHRSRRNA